MSKRLGSKGADAKGGATTQATGGDVPANCAPLTPRPTLFVGLLLVFAIWFGGLLALYFKTVYPQRHPAQGATTTSRS